MISHMYNICVKTSRLGKVVALLVGDFCQTLPVIPRSTLVGELGARIKSSTLCHNVKKLTLIPIMEL